MKQLQKNAHTISINSSIITIKRMTTDSINSQTKTDIQIMVFVDSGLVKLLFKLHQK